MLKYCDSCDGFFLFIILLIEFNFYFLCLFSAEILYKDFDYERKFIVTTQTADGLVLILLSHFFFFFFQNFIFFGYMQFSGFNFVYFKVLLALKLKL